MNEIDNYKEKHQPIYTINNKHVTACTINWIVEHLFYKKEYKQITQTITKCNLWEELFQDVMIYLLNKDVKQIQQLIMNGEIKFYFTKIVKNQWESTSSTFYHRNKKNNYRSEEIELDNILFADDEEEKRNRIKEEFKQEKTLIRINEEVNKLDWYQKKIWDMYQQTKSVPKISRETKIKESSIYKTLSEVKSILKKNIKY